MIVSDTSPRLSAEVAAGPERRARRAAGDRRALIDPCPEPIRPSPTSPRSPPRSTRRPRARAPVRATWPRYLEAILADQQEHAVVGPLLDGHGPSGTVVHRDRVLATWGAPDALEMSFSATKSYLSLVAGLAWDRGLIGDLDEPVVARVEDAALSTTRDGDITWHHLLQQTSQWSGTLWGKPWWCDPQGGQAADAELGPPGREFAYNDVRINLLAFALTVVWRRRSTRCCAST